MKLKLPAKEDVAIDMAPMIDMVFLLLIFFMVASVAADEKKEVKIPESKFAKISEVQKDRLLLSVTPDGTIYNGLVQTTLGELKQSVAEEYSQNERLKVVIRADETVPYKVNKEIMKLCASVSVFDIIFATFEE